MSKSMDELFDKIGGCGCGGHCGCHGTYTVNVYCTNCDWSGIKTLRRGETFNSFFEKCPRCCCATLQKGARPYNPAPSYPPVSPWEPWHPPVTPWVNPYKPPHPRAGDYWATCLLKKSDNSGTMSTAVSCR